MSATNAFETELLSLIFENQDVANVGDATGLRGSSTPGVFYISLHTSDPGEAGGQNTGEALYTNYARASVARNTTEWTAAGNTVDNDNAITFNDCLGGSETLTDFGIGSDAALSAAGNLFIYGSLTASLAVSNGITPQFAAGALDVTLD